MTPEEQVSVIQQREAMQHEIERLNGCIREMAAEMKGLRIRLQRAHAQEGDNDGG